jgi:Leucine-rich repeat (LRR) protein
MCRHLLTLDLSHNQLHDLPGPFAKLHSLNILDVSNNKFSIFPEGISHFRGFEERALITL